MSPAGKPGPPPPVLLRARNLTIRYGPHPAVVDVGLEVARGEVLGLLGPNGAGKTTLLRRLAGILPSQAGTVELAGSDPAADPAARRRIGYLPENPPIYPDETALGYVSFLAALSGVPRRRRRAAAEDALRRAQATDLGPRLTGRLSRGQRQRVALAGAIVHGPDVLLLDEPSEGLDPRQKVAFRKLIGALAAPSDGEATAIVFSSHLLAEVSSVCHRVVVLDGGRVALDRSVGGDGKRLRVVVDGAEPQALAALLRGVSGVTAVADGICEVASDDVASRIAKAVTSKGWQLRELGPAPDDLEAAFLASLKGDSVSADIPGDSQ
ncbi:MAG TPA: ABC transporter ATP-binding protein [Sporichthya sp.]|nr:ABC transporter ATP-binding protein [Sporichthya sp.]